MCTLGWTYYEGWDSSVRQEYIETFLEIIKTQNISIAAENLHLTQSAASARLKALEEIVGVPLFVRGKGNRNVSLTSHGKKFVPIAERWMLLFGTQILFVIIKSSPFGLVALTVLFLLYSCQYALRSRRLNSYLELR